MGRYKTRLGRQTDTYVGVFSRHIRGINNSIVNNKKKSFYHYEALMGGGGRWFCFGFLFFLLCGMFYFLFSHLLFDFVLPIDEGGFLILPFFFDLPTTGTG